MAESQTIAKQALKKLEDQLTCAICLDAFKDPRVLQCFHIYCKDCLQQLVVTDKQGQLSLRCPTCRQSMTLPPATGVSGLQSAFHIHHLFVMQDALKKVEEPQKVLCTKCNKNRPATAYCCDCGKYICALCTAVHSDWDDFAKHEVVALEHLESKLNKLAWDSLKKVTLYCSLHSGKELELYCETCQELICQNCTISKHCRPEHKYDLIVDMFEKHQADITAALDQVEGKARFINEALKQVKQKSADIDDQRVVTIMEIQKIIKLLHETLEGRKHELIGKVNEYADQKIKDLAVQKETLEIIQTQLVSCLSFVRGSLRTGSQGEVMKIKEAVIKQIKEMTDKIKSDILSPCAIPDVDFVPSSEIVYACKQFGEVYARTVSPKKCYATGKGLELAKVGHLATAVIHTLNNRGENYAGPVRTKCELVSATTSMKTKCSVKSVDAGKYMIGYQPPKHGMYQLHIKVEGEHIKGSPFNVIVKVPLKKLNIGPPVRIISGLKGPWGVAVNQRGEIIVAEQQANCISIFCPTGQRLRSFGSPGSGRGQFDGPRGVAVDDEGNILVVDAGNNRIQKFKSDGQFVMAVGGNYFKVTVSLSNPVGISIDPDTKRIFVSDHDDHRIVVLNPNLTYNSSFGSSYVSCDDGGRISNPWEVAFDSDGNIYQGGEGCSSIQVFNTKGEFLREFGQGKLKFPSGVDIDDDDVVYVTEFYNNRVSAFTADGTFLASFGTSGSGRGQFRNPYAVAVKSGHIYISDSGNGRLQIF